MFILTFITIRTLWKAIAIFFGFIILFWFQIHLFFYLFLGARMFILTFITIRTLWKFIAIFFGFIILFCFQIHLFFYQFLGARMFIFTFFTIRTLWKAQAIFFGFIILFWFQIHLFLYLFLGARMFIVYILLLLLFLLRLFYHTRIFLDMPAIGAEFLLWFNFTSTICTEFVNSAWSCLWVWLADLTWGRWFTRNILVFANEAFCYFSFFPFFLLFFLHLFFFPLSHIFFFYGFFLCFFLFFTFLAHSTWVLWPFFKKIV